MKNILMNRSHFSLQLCASMSTLKHEQKYETQYSICLGI